jgi:gas vesicle protein
MNYTPGSVHLPGYFKKEVIHMDNGSGAAGAAGAGIGGMFMGILIGAVIGGVVALLFAPQPGTQTREMVRNRFGQFREVFRRTASDIGETAENTAEQVKQGAREMRESAQ